jgi:hypothetical protein
MNEGIGNTTKRARRIEEAILEIEGVVKVQVWELPNHVEIGVRVAPSDTLPDVLTRVHELIDALREGEEVWEAGILTEG